MDIVEAIVNRLKDESWETEILVSPAIDDYEEKWGYVEVVELNDAINAIISLLNWFDYPRPDNSEIK